MALVEALKWPVTALIALVVLVWWFGPDVSECFRRVKRLWGGPVGADMASSQPQELPKKEEVAAEELMRVMDSSVVKEYEEAIKKDLSSRGLAPQSEKTVEVLIRHLAIAHLARFFETVDRTIWGSQIRLLLHLNANAHRGFSQEELKPFYDDSASQSLDKLSSYSPAQYLGFLSTYGLIVLRDGFYFITPLGREFLSFLVAVGRTGPRPL